MICTSMCIELTGIFKQITCLRTSINFIYFQQDQVWYYLQKSHKTGTTVPNASQPLCSRPLAHNSNCTRILPIPSCLLDKYRVQCLRWSHWVPASSEFRFLFCRTQNDHTRTARGAHIKVHTKNKSNRGKTTETTGLKTNIKHKKISWAFKKKQTLY